MRFFEGKLPECFFLKGKPPVLRGRSFPVKCPVLSGNHLKNNTKQLLKRSVGLRSAPTARIRLSIKSPFGLQEDFLEKKNDRFGVCLCWGKRKNAKHRLIRYIFLGWFLRSHNKCFLENFFGLKAASCCIWGDDISGI